MLSFRAHLGKGCASSKKSPAFSKMRTFKKWCASSNNVRTFGRASALHPVPFARKVVQALASASIALCCVEPSLIDKPSEPNLIDNPAEPTRNSARRIARHRVQGRALVTRPANKKSRAWIFDPGTAPRMRDLQLVAVPYFVVR
jgi:hypothetical protein